MFEQVDIFAVKSSMEENWVMHNGFVFDVYISSLGGNSIVLGISVLRQLLFNT